MNLISSEINEYCLSVSSTPSVQSTSIEKYTVANVPMSVMLVGPLVGGFIGFLVSLVRAKRALEIGCFTGYSALAMAERLPSDGELITLDINSETNAIAKKFWATSPHGSKIKSIVGPASESLNLLQPAFDFVFIDADKTGYAGYVKQALPLLSPQGLIVCDNCLYGGEVLECSPKDLNAKAIKEFNSSVSKDPRLESLLLPVRDGLMLIRKKTTQPS